MNKRVLFAAAIFLVSICLSIIPVAAEAGGYTVGPATTSMLTGPSHDLKFVQIWELPPRVLAIYAALLVFPLLVFPVELFFFLKLVAYLGYRKIMGKNVLDHPSRTRIYDYIVRTPGTDFTEIAKNTGISANTLRYHLAVLKWTNKVTLLQTSRNTRYFENSGRYPALEQKILKYLHNKPTRTLLQLLSEQPDMTRMQLENATGVSGPGISWQMHRLSDDGILAIRKTGRNARYELSDEAVLFLEKHLPRYREETSVNREG